MWNTLSGYSTKILDGFARASSPRAETNIYGDPGAARPLGRLHLAILSCPSGIASRTRCARPILLRVTESSIAARAYSIRHSSRRIAASGISPRGESGNASRKWRARQR